MGEIGADQIREKVEEVLEAMTGEKRADIDPERLARATERAKAMLDMATAVAKARSVSKLEIKYGIGAVDRALVQPDPMDLLEATGWLALFVGCGMQLPPDGPKDFFLSNAEDGACQNSAT